MRLRGCLNRHGGMHGGLKGVFWGARGMRGIWRALLFLALLAVQLLALTLLIVVVVRATGTALLAIPPEITPSFTLLNELILLLPVLGASAAMAVLEDVPMASYGLGGQRKLRRLLAGLAAGLAALSLLVLALAATGYGVAAWGRLGLLGNLRYGAEWLGVSMLIGFTEEFAFRGYLLKALEMPFTFWPAAFVTSLAFGGLHGMNHGETFVGLVEVACVGMVLCIGLRFTRSLWWSIGFHGGWDYAENYIYGTRDSGNPCFGTLMSFTPHGNVWLSGGLTGPEGSVLALGVAALAGFCAWYAFSAFGKRVPGKIRPI